MKVRKVVISMEVETDIGLRELRSQDLWDITSFGKFEINQIQANVIKEDKPKK